MKAVFYAGAALMIGASIYGFVDYKNTTRNEEFKTLYEEKKERNLINTPATETKLVTPEDPKPAVKQVPLLEKKGKNVSTASKTKKVKGSKKIHYKEFSRAALSEKEFVPPVTPKGNN